MAVRQFRRSWWIDFRVGGVRYRKRSPLNTMAGAKEYEAQLRQRLLRGEEIGIGNPAGSVPARFADAANKWLETYVATNAKPSTQASYRSIVQKHLVSRFGAAPVPAVTNYEIEHLKSSLRAKGLSPKRINNILSCLRKFLSSCREWGWLKTTPSVTWLRVPPQRFDFLTIDEGARLLEANRDRLCHDMVLCALRTGMRLGELLALRWADVDFERGMLVVRRSRTGGVESSPKNNRIRYIPMSPDLRESLLARRRHSDHVFPREQGGPLSTWSALDQLREAAHRAQLRHFGWHVLRHSFASQLAAAGVPLVAIQALLGHSTIQMTMRYAHLAPTTLQSAVDVLFLAQRSKNGQPAGNIALEGGASRAADAA